MLKFTVTWERVLLVNSHQSYPTIIGNGKKKCSGKTGYFGENRYKSFRENIYTSSRCFYRSIVDSNSTTKPTSSRRIIIIWKFNVIKFPKIPLNNKQYEIQFNILCEIHFNAFSWEIHMPYANLFSSKIKFDSKK
jgi:hypothetical protein